VTLLSVLLDMKLMASQMGDREDHEEEDRNNADMVRGKPLTDVR
jgi:hypothetical protein